MGAAWGFRASRILGGHSAQGFRLRLPRSPDFACAKGIELPCIPDFVRASGIELPRIPEFACVNGLGLPRILDLACANGLHAPLLAQSTAGYLQSACAAWVATGGIIYFHVKTQRDACNRILRDGSKRGGIINSFMKTQRDNFNRPVRDGGNWAG